MILRTENNVIKNILLFISLILPLFSVKTYTFEKEWKEVSNHDEAHELGHLVYGRSGIDGVVYCKADFAYGCYHGFFEEALKDSSNLVEIEASCVKAGEIDSTSWASCIHGIGHGLISLKACDNLSLKARAYCYDGVYMELVRSDNKPFDCKVEEKYKIACARNLPSVTAKYESSDLKHLVDVCYSYKDEAINKNCMKAVAMKVGMDSKGFEKYVLDNCKLIPMLGGECVDTALKEIEFQGYTLTK